MIDRSGNGYLFESRLSGSQIEHFHYKVFIFFFKFHAVESIFDRLRNPTFRTVFRLLICLNHNFVAQFNWGWKPYKFLLNDEYLRPEIMQQYIDHNLYVSPV
jgi:hypothetical protein